MTTSGLPLAMRQLIWNHLRTLDHVAILLALSSVGAAEAGGVALQTKLPISLVGEILEELHMHGLVVRHAAGYRFDPDPSLRCMVAQLAEMYHTKPVTLVRTIYDRGRT